MVDGIKGFPEVITAVFSLTQVQTCIVHLIRSSLEYRGWKDRKPSGGRVQNDLPGRDRGKSLGPGTLGQEKSPIALLWKRQWEQIVKTLGHSYYTT